VLFGEAMEFVPGSRMVERYGTGGRPPPGVFQPSSANPTGVANTMFAPKLSPQILGNPTFRMVTQQERAMTSLSLRNPWGQKAAFATNSVRCSDAIGMGAPRSATISATLCSGAPRGTPLNNRLPSGKSGNSIPSWAHGVAYINSRKEAAQAPPPPQPDGMPMRGGWPAAGQFNRSTGGWFTGSAPLKPAADKAIATYGWKHRHWVRTSPLGACTADV